MIDFTELLAAIPHESGCDRRGADDPDIGWCYQFRYELALQIKKLDRPEPPPDPVYQSGDRVLISWGFGEYDHGTISQHKAGMVLVEVDKPDGGWYHQWISASAVHHLRKGE